MIMIKMQKMKIKFKNLEMYLDKSFDENSIILSPLLEKKFNLNSEKLE